MKRVRLSRDAQRELHEIVAWLRKHRTEQLAQATLNELLSAVARIAKFPEAWGQLENSPYRARRLPKLRYSIIYEVTEHDIHVLAFAHMSREENYWRVRDE